MKTKVSVDFQICISVRYYVTNYFVHRYIDKFLSYLFVHVEFMKDLDLFFVRNNNIISFLLVQICWYFCSSFSCQLWSMILQIMISKQIRCTSLRSKNWGWWYCCRRVLRTLSDIYERAFSENSYLLWAVNCFHRKVYLRCLTGFLKRPCYCIYRFCIYCFLRLYFKTHPHILRWCSRFIWIKNSIDHKRVWTANLLHT